MANTWATGYLPNIISDSRQFLRKQCAFLAMTNKDFSQASGIKGSTVNIPIPATLSAASITPANYSPDGTAQSLSTATLTLDNFQGSTPFAVTNQHLQNYQLEGPGSILQQMINSAIAAVVDAVATDLQSKYYQIPTFVGVGGSAFFYNGGAYNITGLTNARKELFAQKVPADRPLYGVFSYLDVAHLRNVTTVQQAYSIGTPTVIQDGAFPSIMGFGIKEDYFVTSHTVGTLKASNITKAATAQAVGTTSLVCTTPATTSACALKKGDIITYAGANYSVQANVTQATASTDYTITLDRGIETAAAGSEAVTLATNFGSGRTNIAGDLMGASLVTRLPSNPAELSDLPAKLMGEHIPVVDPVSGMAILLSFYGQYHQRMMQASLIWGSAMTDPRRLVRCLSATA
jgi:hypothetical protein